jgi:hypothetical protein
MKPKSTSFLGHPEWDEGSFLVLFVFQSRTAFYELSGQHSLDFFYLVFRFFSRILFCIESQVK